MEATQNPQTLTLTQFMIDLATNPQLQMKLAGLYKDALYRFFTEHGLDAEDAELIVGAYSSDEGKKKLDHKLTYCGNAPNWTCSTVEKAD